MLKKITAYTIIGMLGIAVFPLTIILLPAKAVIWAFHEAPEVDRFIGPSCHHGAAPELPTCCKSSTMSMYD